MGLLTNEQSRNVVVTILVKHNQKLCFLSYVVGLLWFLSLAYQPLNASTYFSENALLPGLVVSELPTVLTTAVKYNDILEAEMMKDTKVTPHHWVYKQFKELGLETFKQNFSVVYPFRSLTTKMMTGENVYAILRARRASSTEALVLSVPLRPVANKVKIATGGGIALALALAHEFKQKPYWSKDIIFLFSDFDEIGAMAWLDAYHQTESEYIVTQGLEGRSGPIQAAINLELPFETVYHYNIRLEGLNGQLPNLDLVNLVVRLCRREYATVTIHNSLDIKKMYGGESTGDSFEDYKLSLSTMLKMMWYQASGAPSGNHGMFQKFHIESVTLQGIGRKDSRYDITTTARIIEGTFRSLNNLLERFHQSFFFYLLPSTTRYVSIGMYMPPFGLMALAGLLKHFGLVLIMRRKRRRQMRGQRAALEEEQKGRVQNKKKMENNPEESQPETLPMAEDGGSGDHKIFQEEEEDFIEPPATKGVMTIIPIILVALLLGWMAHQGPELLTRIMPRFRIHTEDMVIYSMLAIFTAAMMYPKLMTRKASNPNALILDWRLLKSVALIGQTLALASIALLNISQAFFLTVFMVPVTTLVRPAHKRLYCWIQMLALVLVSPMLLMLFVGMLSAWPQSSAFSFLMQSYTNTKELIFLGVMDAYLFNAWTETIITAVIFPLWLLFWAIPWVDPL